MTSTGSMDPKQIIKIQKMTRGVSAGKIFAIAFLEFKTYKKFSENLVWQTE